MIEQIYNWHPAKERTTRARKTRKIVAAIDQQIRFITTPSYTPTRLTWKAVDPWVDELVEIPTGLRNCSQKMMDGSIRFYTNRNVILKNILPPVINFENEREALVFLVKLKEIVESNRRLAMPRKNN